MNKKFVLALVAFVVFCAGFHESVAQGPLDAPPPTAPFIQPVPENAAWKLTITNLKETHLAPSPKTGSNAAKPVRREVRQRQVVKTGQVRKEITTWSDGITSQVWGVGADRVVENPETHDIMLVDPARHFIAASALLHDDFLTINWPSLDTFVRVESYQGQLCYRYEKKVQPEAPATPVSDDPEGQTRSRLPGTAWVAVETRRLAAYSDGEKLYAYTYGEAPTEKLQLPAEYAKVWQKYHDDLNPLKMPIPPSR